jgi:putative ABC transport system permease protein
MTNLLTDVRLVLRTSLKAPGFAAIAILSIALGIGANAAVFTLVDQVLLRTLPVSNPDALVQLVMTGNRYGNNWGDGSELSYLVFAELRDNAQVFDGVFGRFGTAFTVGAEGRSERILGELVSGNYFPVLGVGSALGRTIGPDDDRVEGGHPVAVLSHSFWRTRFNADPSVLNSTLTINGHPYTIIGVARPGFDGIEVGRMTQVFVPLMMKRLVTPTWNGLDDRLNRWVRVFARLKPGITREQAKAALAPLFATVLERDLAAPGFANAGKDTRTRYQANTLLVSDASQGRSGFRRNLTTPLWVLMATAIGVLLIACANIANLLLARGAARQREMAVRLALGATRARLVSQLLAESLMLAGAGGLVGVAISAAAAPMLLGFFLSPDGPQPISTSPDWRILAFTGAITLATGILFGLVPAFQSSRPNVAPTLKDSATSVLGGRGRLRKALVASQIGISLLLLIGAALFIRTLNNLLAVDIGFETTHLVSFGVAPSLSGYDSPRVRTFTKALLERLNSAPGIEAAGLATTRLLEGNQWMTSMTVAGYQAKGSENSSQWANAVSYGYFKAMGIPILVGRDFTDHDERTTPAPPGTSDYRIAIVNEMFARHYFGDSNPIGRRIGFGGNLNTPTPIEIVGVVRDSKYTDVRDATQRQVFFPFFEDSQLDSYTVYVRTNRPADVVFNTIRQTVAGLDPNIPIHGARTLEKQVALSLSRERMVATMTVAFGTLATLLAVIGLYGVMSYTVSRRTREIGVRVALGATAPRIGWLVIREVLVIGAVGVTLALPAAWWLGRYVSTQLYGVEPNDPVAIGAAVALLLTVAIAAGLIPSSHAARLDPTVALRQD